MNSAEPEAPCLYVEVKGREKDGQRFQIGAEGLLVGRSDTCDVAFENREISRRHAYFYLDASSCYVEDLGSKNGISVNGKRVKKRPVHPGDIVDIGPTRLFVQAEVERTGLARWIAPRRGPAEDSDADEVYSGVSAVSLGGSLALASLVFGVLAYLHWVFGLCAVVLALLAFWEMRGESLPLRRALLAGGLALGIVGGGLNAWFEQAAPRRRGTRQLSARAECERNLSRIRHAIKAFTERHEGLYPNRLRDLVTEGLLKAKDLRCPGARRNLELSGSYLYAPPRPDESEDPYGMLVCDSDEANHQGVGGWALRRNGRLDWVPGEQFAHLLAKWKEPRQPSARMTEPGQ